MTFRFNFPLCSLTYMGEGETVSKKERGDSCGCSTKTPRLAEYVRSVLEEAKRRNPQLADLDRLAEVLPPRRMTYWPYFVGRWDVA
jgi:hypothetical protein